MMNTRQLPTHRRGAAHQLRRNSVIAAVVASPPVPASKSSPASIHDLPPSLRNSVVVLDAANPNAPGGVTKTYLLGMSHVSKKSVEQVKELVRAVQPDVVCVELCKDRLSLLVDSAEDSITSMLWHCRRISIEGLPSANPEWPTWDQIKGLLRCQPGKPVSTADIEADVNTLLSTGLFRSARPSCQSAGINEAPAFLPAPEAPQASSDGSSGTRMQAVPPLGSIKFIVQERVFPPVTQMSIRVDSSLKSLPVTKEEVDAVVAEVQSSNSSTREGGPIATLTCLLRARAKLIDMFGGQGKVVVAFSGSDTGKVEVTVRAARPSDPSLVSGFESTAVNGEGWGIESFKPTKNLFKVSTKMYLTPEYLEQLKGQGLASGSQQWSNGSSATTSSFSSTSDSPPRSEYRPWSSAEIEGYQRPPYPDAGAASILGDLLTMVYAKNQSTAARNVGVTPGSAWQAALAAATEAGSQQVLLIDRPTIVTEKRLAEAVFARTGFQLGAAAALVLATLVGSLATDILPETTELLAFAGSVGAAAALLWPLLGPINEVSRLAGMSAEEVEDAVAIKSPVAGTGDLSQPLKLFGEDALLDWPGAMEPIIRDRDTFMAKALAGAATGSSLFVPAFVRDKDPGTGRPLWRFMMPEQGPLISAPQGLGDGAVQPLKSARAVVGIVGSAHVRGMVREWSSSVQQPREGVDKLLEY